MTTLEEIRKRWSAVTDWPWEAVALEDPNDSSLGHVELILRTDHGGFPPSDEDVEAVEHARADVEWLLKQAEELAAIKERARSRIAANAKRLTELRQELLTHPSYAINVEEGRLFAEHSLLGEVVGGLEEECAAARIEYLATEGTDG